MLIRSERLKGCLLDIKCCCFYKLKIMLTHFLKLHPGFHCLHLLCWVSWDEMKHVSTVSTQAMSRLGGARGQNNCVYFEILLLDRQPRVRLGDEVPEIIREWVMLPLMPVIQHFEERWHPRHHSLFVCLCWCNAMMALGGIAASPSRPRPFLTSWVAFVLSCLWNQTLW